MERVINTLRSLAKSPRPKEPFEHALIAEQKEQLELPLETLPRTGKLSPSEK